MDDTLISTENFADVGYITIFMDNKVNIYDATKITIVIDQKAVLWWWRFPRTAPYRISLIPEVKNENTDTLLLSKLDSLRLQVRWDKQVNQEKINLVYDLPSVEQVIQWHHALLSVLTKSTWLRVIREGKFTTWPLVLLKTWTNTFWNPKRRKKGTWDKSNKDFDQPNHDKMKEKSRSLLQSTKKRCVR